MLRSGSLLLVLGFLACGPSLAGDGDASTGDADPGSTSAGSASGGTGSLTTGPGPAGTEAGTVVTGDIDLETSSTSSASTSSSTSATDTGREFLVIPDGETPGDNCSPFLQDCPPDEKCMPWADDGGSAWNNLKCSPLDPDPKQLHEPCTAPQGPVAGIDDCDVGLMCWNVDDDDHGTCYELCGGEPEAPTCEDPNATCLLGGDTILALCFPTCDPLLQNCDAPDACIANPTGENFLCVLDASGEGGAQHDECTFANACDPGLLCNDPTAAVECDPDALGCCEPFCDLGDPEADAKCGGVGQVCNPYFEEGTAPPNLEDVGYCAVPM